MTRQEALDMRARVEFAATRLEDKEASLSAWMFPKLKYDGSLIDYQYRINWHGKIMMAKTTLWDREENDPAHAPDLWAEIEYYKGYRYIKANASAAEAFKFGEVGWWQSELWESLMEGNPYTPETAPSVWKKVTL